MATDKKKSVSMPTDQKVVCFYGNSIIKV